MKELKHLCLMWATQWAIIAAILIVVTPVPVKSIGACLVMAVLSLAGAVLAERKERA